MRLWAILVRKLRGKIIYLFLYRSWWHFKLTDKSVGNLHKNYLSAVPNPGAGIGHQMANWIAGYWFARQFGLRFAHTVFSNKKWEHFLGFGEDEIRLDELLNKNYKKVLLPLFDEYNSQEVALIKKIIESYNGQGVVFVFEQDQSYQDQFGVMDDLRLKFHNAPARRDDQLRYSKDFFNIAIHVRRGDIVPAQENKNSNLMMRWQDNTYFEKVLSTVIANLKLSKPIAIYLFSQGERGDFPEFEKFQNIHYCMEMNAYESFLHMVFADLLITSKSSFSYKPALLSNGIKICPRDFWHGYPNSEDWVLVEEEGMFDVSVLNVVNL